MRGGGVDGASDVHAAGPAGSDVLGDSGPVGGQRLHSVRVFVPVAHLVDGRVSERGSGRLRGSGARVVCGALHQCGAVAQGALSAALLAVCTVPAAVR